MVKVSSDLLFNMLNNSLPSNSSEGIKPEFLWGWLTNYRFPNYGVRLLFIHYLGPISSLSIFAWRRCWVNIKRKHNCSQEACVVCTLYNSLCTCTINIVHFRCAYCKFWNIFFQCISFESPWPDDFKNFHIFSRGFRPQSLAIPKLKWKKKYFSKIFARHIKNRAHRKTKHAYDLDEDFPPIFFYCSTGKQNLVPF